MAPAAKASSRSGFFFVFNLIKIFFALFIFCLFIYFYYFFMSKKRTLKIVFYLYLAEYQFLGKNTSTKINERKIFYKYGIFHCFHIVHTTRDTGRFCADTK